jgi:hypothetical protein
METTDEVGQAKPEPGNATSFNWWLFTYNTTLGRQNSLLIVLYYHHFVHTSSRDSCSVYPHIRVFLSLNEKNKPHI